MQITSRDQNVLLYWLGLFGALTTSQCHALSKISVRVIQRRFRLLRENRMVDFIQTTPNRLGRGEFLSFLTQQGAELVGCKPHTPRRTNALTHTMKNNDILIRIKNEFENNPDYDCSILPEHLIRQAQLSVIPDGAFALHSKNNDKSAIFLFENDSGSQILASPSYHNDIEVKLATYNEMFKNDGIQFYRDYFETQIKRFRLLIITRQASRLASLCGLVKRYDETGYVCLTTHDLFDRKGISGPSWAVPAYSKAECSIVGE